METVMISTVSERINVNGVITPADRAVISPLDRGFIYGDGVYETVRAHGGIPFRLRPHLDRLRRSAERLTIPIDRLTVDIETEVLRTLGEAAIAEAAIRIVMTRGVGPICYDPVSAGPPTTVIYVRPAPEISGDQIREGVDVVIVSVTRNAPVALDPAIKSCNLINNLLAWMEADSQRAFEPILLNTDGHLAEGASSNVFVVREGHLATPPLEDGLLRGITRDIVLDLARREGVPTSEKSLDPDDLRKADEAFITSTLKGILPVRRCDGWPVHDGRPGEVTLRLLRALQTLVQEETKAGSRPGTIRR